MSTVRVRNVVDRARCCRRSLDLLVATTPMCMVVSSAACVRLKWVELINYALGCELRGDGRIRKAHTQQEMAFQVR